MAKRLVFNVKELDTRKFLRLEDGILRLKLSSLKNRFEADTF